MNNLNLARMDKAFSVIVVICLCCIVSLAQSAGKETPTKASTAPVDAQTKPVMPVPPKEDVEKLISLTLSLAEKATDPAAVEKARIVAFACKAAIGQADDALAQVNKLQTPLDKAKLYLMIAYNLIKAQRFKQAKKCINDALNLFSGDEKNDPKNQWVFIYAAKALFFDLNSPKEAKVLCDGLCEAAVRNGRMTPEGGELAWRIYIKMGEYEKALSILELLKKELFGLECETYCEIASNKFDLKDAAGAKQALDKAQTILYQQLKKDPNPLGFDDFIKACKKTGDADMVKDAIGKFKDMVDLHLKSEKDIQYPTDSIIRTLGKSYAIAGDTAGMDALIKTVAKKKPSGKDFFTNQYYYFAMIYLYTAKKDYSKVMEYYDALLKTNDDPEETGSISVNGLLWIFDGMSDAKDALLVMKHISKIPCDFYKLILMTDGIKALARFGAVDEAAKCISDMIKDIKNMKITEAFSPHSDVAKCYVITGDIKGLLEYINTIPQVNAKVEAATKACQQLSCDGMFMKWL
ncbi:MAG: hypothetical protein HZA50_02460 [Planctomycetes bacterium]|nr:hypothetical protein [Planctomycetota bacterium]